MNEKLEQVKRALIKHEGDNLSKALDDAFWESTARAAIEAMREPTDEMLEAAWSSNWQGLSHNIAKRAWQAMLDEALK